MKTPQAICEVFSNPRIMLADPHTLNSKELALRHSIPLFSRYIYCDCTTIEPHISPRPISICDDRRDRLYPELH
jgi:hypothetical protein